MKKIVVCIAAAGVLVAGAFAASMVVDGQALAQTGDELGVERTDIPRPEGILDEVLGELVADETLDQDQADAVKAALEAGHEEVRTQLDERRGEKPGKAERDPAMAEMLEDSVIDAGELAELTDDHPLKDPNGPAAEFLEDGELSVDELRKLGGHRRPPRDGDRADSTDV
jgi:hypothetical protein